MKISVDYERTFWRKVYLAAIRSGKYNADAQIIANQAIGHLRETYI